MVLHIEKIRPVNPPESPLSLADIKAFLRIEHNNDDATLNRLARAAVEHLENETGQAIMQRQWNLICRGVPQSRLRLPMTPAVSIVSVKVQDFHSEMVMSPEQYSLQGDLLYFHCLPSMIRIDVAYLAGNCTGEENLEPHIAGILLDMISSMYDGRGCDEVIKSDVVARMRRCLL